MLGHGFKRWVPCLNFNIYLAGYSISWIFWDSLWDALSENNRIALIFWAAALKIWFVYLKLICVIFKTCFFSFPSLRVCYEIFFPLIQVNMKMRRERFLDVPLCATDCDDWFHACKDDYTCTDNWTLNFKWINGTNHCRPESECRTFSDIFQNSSNFCERVGVLSYIFHKSWSIKSFSLRYGIIRGSIPATLNPACEFGSMTIKEILTKTSLDGRYNKVTERKVFQSCHFHSCYPP